MLDNLKIAVKRQRKLIIIFLLTIFLPSLALSVFGVRAIRNERFRLAQQREEEHRRAAAFLKNRINSRFEQVEIALQNLAQNPSFGQEDYPSIKEALADRFHDDPLIELVFLSYQGEAPLFPLFLPAPPAKAAPAVSPPDGPQRDRLERAERMEFGQKNYSEAAVLYEQVLSRAGDADTQALMLNNMGRCYAKLQDYDRAIQAYSRLCQEYPHGTTSSSLPLDLIGRIQIVKCCRNKGDHQSFVSNAFQLYRDILRRQWPLDADQFRTYSSMLEKDLSDDLAGDESDPEKDSHAQEFNRLKELRREIDEKWHMVNNLKSSILPELHKRLGPDPASASAPLRHSGTIGQENYLVVASPVPQEGKRDVPGLLGVKIDERAILDQEINRLWEDFPFSQEASLSVSTLSGRILTERGKASSDNPAFSAYFEDGFPPWRIDFFSTAPGHSGVADLRRSFYFWTILTVLILLTFGAVLVVRTVTQEMEVLRVKSDFVSSVSHEFKTPITSIKVLIERLQQGTVTSVDKTKEYYSIIAKDADKLNSLVRNILDYSKVDAGQRPYFFQPTDLAQLVREGIEGFERDKIYAGIKIDARVAPGVPPLDIDREAVSLALDNLLENAVKFSPGRKTISVEVRREEESVRVDVRDQGLGIDPGEVDRIFDRFYQGKDSARRSLPGTGLGLTLVKHVMDAHGGKVQVRSEPGQGSTFSLVFPLKTGRD